MRFRRRHRDKPNDLVHARLSSARIQIEGTFSADQLRRFADYMDEFATCTVPGPVHVCGVEGSCNGMPRSGAT